MLWRIMFEKPLQIIMSCVLFRLKILAFFVFSTLSFFLKVTAGILLPFSTHNDDLHRATVELWQPAIY